MSKKERNQI